MAPLNPNATARYFVDYEGPMGKRTFQVRDGGGAGVDGMTTGIIQFLNTLQPAIYASVVFGTVRVASAGSNVSNPIAWSPMSGSAVGTLLPENYPRFIDFVGRSTGGRRVRLSIYGSTNGITPDYRLALTEATSIANAVAYLNSAGCPFVCIDGQKPIWKAYANQGYNAYHQRQRRATA